MINVESDVTVTVSMIVRRYGGSETLGRVFRNFVALLKLRFARLQSLLSKLVSRRCAEDIPASTIS